MNKIEHVPFRSGEAVLKKAKTTKKNVRTEAHWAWSYELSPSHAREAQDALTDLQAAGCRVTLKANDQEWTGNCTVQTFKMIPNANRGNPSSMKGTLSLFGTPDMLKAFSNFVVDVESADSDEVDVQIWPLQDDLPGMSEPRSEVEA